MNTENRRAPFFLNGMVIFAMLLGLFVSISLLNISNVKAQNISANLSNDYTKSSRISFQNSLQSKVLTASEGLDSVVYVVQGTQQREILRVPFEQMPFPMFDPYVSISPDGRYATYVVVPDSHSATVSLENAALWLVDLTTNERWGVREFPDNLWTAPIIWSPDSSKFAFVQVAQEPFVGNGGLELWSVNAQTRVSQLLISNPLFNSEVFYQKIGTPVEWDANSQAVTFTVYDATAQQETMYSFPIDESPYRTTASPFSSTEEKAYSTQREALSCSVPLYNQLDPQWKSIIMKTCTLSIGSSGCALTSTAMTFKYYGVSTDPNALNQCLGNYACPIYWGTAASNCSSGKVSYVGAPGFSWARVEQELQQGYPPMLYLCKPDCNSLTHFVVAVSGSGTTASNYTINDPNGGVTRNLTYYTNNGWVLSGLRIYHGTPNCDSIPPITSATLTGTVGENGWYSSAVQVTLTATDNSGGSGVSQTQYEIDAGAWQTYSASFSVSANGPHTVYYKSVDAKGNWETVKSINFKIDSVAPAGSLLIQNGSAQTYSTAVSLKAQGSDSTSGIAGVRLRDAGQTWSGFSAPGSIFWQLVGSNGQTASVEAQFKDNAGNLSAIYSDSIVINLYPARPSSTQYRLLKSTFSAAGMQANSSAYTMNGTAGQPMVASMQSSNYLLNAGYWANLASSTYNYYAVSGNAGIAGATLTYFDGTSKTVVADSNGNYTIWIPSGWSGTIKPSQIGYVFTPASRSYASSSVIANLVNQNFAASALGSVSLNSVAANDGWVLEKGENLTVGGSLDAATTLRLGDDNLRKQYRSILSFATGPGLPDNAVITSVTLKIKPQSPSVGGATPAMFKGFLVDIRNGFFGTSALQVTDFQAAASTPLAGIAPITTTVGGWYTFNLTASKGYINKLATNAGLTQFRLRFKLDDNNNAIANYINFYSGNSAVNKPTLTIQYYVP